MPNCTRHLKKLKTRSQQVPEKIELSEISDYDVEIEKVYEELGNVRQEIRIIRNEDFIKPESLANAGILT